MTLYVDDIIIATETLTDMNECKQEFKDKFKMEDFGPIQEYLNMKIIYKQRIGSICLNQHKYVTEIVEEYLINKNQKNSIPMREDWDTILDESELLPEDNNYRSIIGKLIHLSNLTRFDITFAVSKLCQYNAKPTVRSMKALQYLLGYLNSTLNYAIQLGGHLNDPEGYSDASYARDPSRELKSHTGIIFKCGSGPIFWYSKLQSITTDSTLYAEWIALYEATRTACYFRNILEDLKIDISKPTMIFEDNTNTIDVALNIGNKGKSRHFDTKYYCTKQRVQENKVHIQWVPSIENIADMFTKPLPRDQLRHLCYLGGMITLIDGEPVAMEGRVRM